MELVKDSGVEIEALPEHVKKFVRDCPICQKEDPRHFEAVTAPFTKITLRPMQRVNVDTIGPLPTSVDGYKYIVVVIDTFTRYLVTFPAKTLEADECAKLLARYTTTYGIPDEFLTDNGGQFVNLHLRHLFELWGVQHIKTIPYSHEENGIVERANKEVMRHLRNIMFNVKILEKWDEFLPYAERIINATKHSEIGFSPVELLYGNSIDLNRHMTYVPEMSNIEYATPETKEQWEA